MDRGRIAATVSVAGTSRSRPEQWGRRKRAGLVPAILLAAGALSGIGCGGGESPAPKAAAPEPATATEVPAPPAGPATTAPATMHDGFAVIEDASQADAALGSDVELVGTANNAKLSAVVTRGDLVVYCLNVPTWDISQHAQELTVRGKLERTDEFEAKPGADGEISQGSDGPVLVIRNCAVVAASP